MALKVIDVLGWARIILSHPPISLDTVQAYTRDVGLKRKWCQQPFAYSLSRPSACFVHPRRCFARLLFLRHFGVGSGFFTCIGFESLTKEFASGSVPVDQLVAVEIIFGNVGALPPPLEGAGCSVSGKVRANRRRSLLARRAEPIGHDRQRTAHAELRFEGARR